MHFVKINVNKYKGASGDIITMPVGLNVDQISYVDRTDEKKLIVHMTGETGSGLFVTDPEAIEIINSYIEHIN